MGDARSAPGKKDNTLNSSGGKPKGKRTFGRPRLRWDNIIKI